MLFFAAAARSFERGATGEKQTNEAGGETRGHFAKRLVGRGGHDGLASPFG